MPLSRKRLNPETHGPQSCSRALHAASVSAPRDYGDHRLRHHRARLSRHAWVRIRLRRHTPNSEEPGHSGLALRAPVLYVSRVGGDLSPQRGKLLSTAVSSVAQAELCAFRRGTRRLARGQRVVPCRSNLPGFSACATTDTRPDDRLRGRVIVRTAPGAH